jgi:glucokinase
VDIFLSIIGAEAGGMALRCLARGGVFIAGGIVPRLMERVKTGAQADKDAARVCMSLALGCSDGQAL